MPTETNGAADKQLTMKVVSHIQKLIETGVLKAGNKIPPEREFATQLEISRASLRAGIGYLAAMGVLKVRHGVGTFVAEEARAVDSLSMHLLSAFNGFKPKQMLPRRDWCWRAAWRPWLRNRGRLTLRQDVEEVSPKCMPPLTTHRNT